MAEDYSKYYINLAAYNELSQSHKLIWGQMFTTFILRDEITNSNAHLAKVFNVAEKTIEKVLKIFDDKGLIVRKCEKKVRGNFMFTASRSIKLSPITFPDLVVVVKKDEKKANDNHSKKEENNESTKKYYPLNF